MNSDNLREVHFEKYCKTCKYSDLEEIFEPCTICLESGMNESTDQPVLWEEKEKR